MKVVLTVIDPQVDFCSPTGSLSVPGAHDDMLRLASMIKKNKNGLRDIYITLDSHTRLHIAHPNFWRNSKGQQPSPFTPISADDVRNGVWLPAKLSLQKRCLDYVEALDRNKKFGLVIWPIHCVIGTPGHCIYGPLQSALEEWQDERFLTVSYVTKGSNPFTEHYSAIKAEVEDPTDPGTHMNINFLNSVNEADIVLLAGEASSHCVANTIRDAVSYFGNTDFAKKLVLLKDATSPVPGFEAQADAMIADMTAAGMRISSTKDWM